LELEDGFEKLDELDEEEEGEEEEEPGIVRELNQVKNPGTGEGEGEGRLPTEEEKGRPKVSSI
jgi:hypothetical protein